MLELLRLSVPLKCLPARPHDLRDPFECPIEFFPSDDKRRAKADDVIVSLLAQDSFVLQGFAIAASRAVKFDTDPQTFSTNFFDGSTAERLKPSEEVSSQFGGPLDHFLFNQDTQGGSGNGASERVSSERTAVIAGRDDTQNRARRKHCRNRIKAAG